MTTDNFQDGRYIGDDVDEVLDALVADAETSFDHEFSESEAIVIRSFYRPVAERIVELHNGITDVLNASQVDFAEGQALDYLGNRLGVTRIEATKASGRARFSRSSPTTTDRFIPEGLIIETDELEPAEFETDYSQALALLDSFEDGDLTNYAGDTGDFTINTTTVSDGDNSLQAAAVSGSDIYTKETTFGPGSKVHVDVYANTNTIPIYRFAVEDADNCYQVRLDTVAGSVELEVVDGGTDSDIETSTVSIPTGEWLELIVDWKVGGDIVVTVENAAGDEVTTFTGHDETYTSDNGFGFKSGDGTATKLFDFNTMSAVGVDVTAVDGGSAGNLGASALTIMPDPPTGIESVINPKPMSGGRDREEDDDYRARIKSELGEGVRGTQRGLIEQLEALDGVKSVTVIENDSSSTDADGRPDHSFEPVVQADSSWYQEIGQTIVETKGTAYPAVGGYAGSSHTVTTELSNGQQKDITFSTPTEIQIYADIDVEKTDTYAGDDQLKDNVVRYIGGILSSGDSEDGKLGVSDDVIYSKVMQAIAGTEGVYDVTNLEIGTASDPTGTGNIAVSDTDIATADATDTSLNISTVNV